MSAQSPRPGKPPLMALRAFEAAGRLGGFAPAAEELGVTPGAITAHLKGLEAALGAPLFDRAPRGVRLTALGAQALPDFTEAFDLLNAAVQRLQASAAPGQVRIATDPGIAQLWLSPRLTALRASSPDISVSITTFDSPPDGERDGHDLYLFFQPLGARPGAWQLSRDMIAPVCAPARAARLHSKADLQAEDCLTDATCPQAWQEWADAAGLSGFAPRGPVLASRALAVEEAVNGAGVLMGHLALLGRHLQDGRLVQPLGPTLARPHTLMLWRAQGARAAAGIVAEGLVQE